MIEHVFEFGGPLVASDVPMLAAAVRALGRADADAAELIDVISRLEELKGTVAAAQARAAAAFAAKQRAEQRAAGSRASQVGVGVGAQVALARRESPHQGGRHLGLAEALVGELPHTLAALDAGQVSEWRATLVVRETACLSVQHRAQVDAELAARPGGLAAMGDRAVAAEARRIGYRLDPYAVARRASMAAADRRVSLRPAPDAMTWLGALLPAQQGVAVYAALSRAAGNARGTGDQRGRGQVMADTLVERITGQATAEAVPVEIQLVMTDSTLLGGDSEPAELEGVGPVPAPLARGWLRVSDSNAGNRDGSDASSDGGTVSDASSDGGTVSDASSDGGTVSDASSDGGTVSDASSGGDGSSPGADAAVWLRRLYTSPTSGQLIGMDSRRRCFDGQLRRFVIAADRTCRTPWCDAPIRHIDHTVPACVGGATSVDNSTGLCEACNYTKQAPGWATSRSPNRGIDVTTPTGHRYTSRPPPAVGQTARRASPPQSSVERRLPDPLAS